MTILRSLSVSNSVVMHIMDSFTSGLNSCAFCDNNQTNPSRSRQQPGGS
jgi:hypothetical protein